MEFSLWAPLSATRRSTRSCVSCREPAQVIRVELGEQLLATAADPAGVRRSGCARAASRDRADAAISSARAPASRAQLSVRKSDRERLALRKTAVKAFTAEAAAAWRPRHRPGNSRAAAAPRSRPAPAVASPPNAKASRFDCLRCAGVSPRVVSGGSRLLFSALVGPESKPDAAQWEAC